MPSKRDARDEAVRYESAKSPGLSPWGLLTFPDRQRVRVPWPIGGSLCRFP